MLLPCGQRGRGAGRRAARRHARATSLAEAVQALNDPASVPRRAAAPLRRARPADAGVRPRATSAARSLARRALEVAAAGGHNLLMVGPPGAGKTMLARRLPGILPPLTFDESLECTAIHSVAGLLPPGVRPARRPARSARRTTRSRTSALVGGGSLPAARRDQPRAQRRAVPRRAAGVRPARARGAAPAARGWARRRSPAPRGRPVFPARFMLVAAMNPCPCGYLGDPARACRCTPRRGRALPRPALGPLRDRIDLVARGAGGTGRAARRRRRRRAVGRGARAGGGRPRPPGGAPRGHGRAPQRGAAGARRVAALPPRRDRAAPARARRRAPRPQRARLPPRAQGRTHDRRPGRHRRCRAKTRSPRRSSTASRTRACSAVSRHFHLPFPVREYSRFAAQVRCDSVRASFLGAAGPADPAEPTCGFRARSTAAQCLDATS